MNKCAKQQAQHTICTLIPVFFLAWGRAKAQEQWREVDGDRAPREGALGPREEGNGPPPNNSPLNSQHRKHL